MQFVHSLVAIFTLFAHVQSEGDQSLNAPPPSHEPTLPPFSATAQVSQGEARLFSGEDVQLSCNVSEDPLAKWKYRWFLNGEWVQSAETYHLKSARVLQGGAYTCQGEKEIEKWPFSIKSAFSSPIQVQVDGGWVLMRTPAEPLIIEETMTLTCRVRGDPLLTSVIFYKNGVKIRQQSQKDLVFPTVTLQDQGSYWCRATWLRRFEHHSAQSVPASVTVLDKLNTPELVMKSEVMEGESVVMTCVTQLNVREKDLSIEYTFMKNEIRVQPTSSRSQFTIQAAEEEDEGFYNCKARVRALDVERWSQMLELKVHGKKA